MAMTTVDAWLDFSELDPTHLYHVHVYTQKQLQSESDHVKIDETMNLAEIKALLKQMAAASRFLTDERYDGQCDEQCDRRVIVAIACPLTTPEAMDQSAILALVNCNGMAQPFVGRLDEAEKHFGKTFLRAILEGRTAWAVYKGDTLIVNHDPDFELP